MLISSSNQTRILMLVLNPYQFISQNLNNRLVDHLLEVHSGVDLRGEGVCVCVRIKGIIQTQNIWKENVQYMHKALFSASKHNVDWTGMESIWNITNEIGQNDDLTS